MAVSRCVATPRQAQELGIALVSQELSLCPDLSVEDNIWLGSLKVPFLHKRPELRRRAGEALALLGAEHIALDAQVASLSMGERQFVEIARMLTRDARVLILDEPTATLTDSRSSASSQRLLALKREGRSIIYITHRLAEVFEICDRVTVLRNGALMKTAGRDGLDRATLIELMLGRPSGEMYPEEAPARGEAALVVEQPAVPGIADFRADRPAAAEILLHRRTGRLRGPRKLSARSPGWRMTRGGR